MIFLALLFVFAVAALAASALVYSEHPWRYAVAVTIVCGTVLSLWGARLLAAALKFFTVEIQPILALTLTTAPFALVVIHLWLRRLATPRHVAGPEDDPVLRRHLEEKRRRRRLELQAAELEERSTDESGVLTDPPVAVSRTDIAR